jgi:hypothetical protein
MIGLKIQPMIGCNQSSDSGSQQICIIKIRHVQPTRAPQNFNQKHGHVPASTRTTHNGSVALRKVSKLATQSHT